MMGRHVHRGGGMRFPKGVGLSGNCFCSVLITKRQPELFKEVADVDGRCERRGTGAGGVVSFRNGTGGVDNGRNRTEGGRWLLTDKEGSESPSMFRGTDDTICRSKLIDVDP